MTKPIPFRIVTDTDLLQARLLNQCRLDESGCWMWVGSKRRGYGLFCLDNKTTTAHRVAYEAWVGPIAKGLKVLHSCDKPGCINPNHLRLGTQKDNAADRQARGRGHKLRGEQIGTAKLTADQVIAIRQSDQSLARLAEKYGIDPSNVWSIRAGKSWRHLN